MSGRTKKYDPTINCLQETYFKYNDIGRLKAKGWKKTYHTNMNQKKAARNQGWFDI